VPQQASSTSTGIELFTYSLGTPVYMVSDQMEANALEILQVTLLHCCHNNGAVSNNPQLCATNFAHQNASREVYPSDHDQL